MVRASKEDRQAVISLHNCGLTPPKILKQLSGLGISKMFVYRTIKRYSETGGIEDRKREGRPRTARTTNRINAVAARIRRNPCRKQKIVAREMGISTRSLSRIIKDDLGMRAYRRKRGHLLTPSLKKIRYQRAKNLLRNYAGQKYKSILFTDEKIFTIEESFNKQNDRVYARSSEEAGKKVSRAQRGHHPASLMVWWGVSYNGVTPLHFCEKGVKTTAKIYQETILEKVVKPLNENMFNGRPWTFQQDSAPAHKAKTTQNWLSKNIPNFIAAEDWPSGSPDLNPLDYKLWSVLEAKTCSKRFPNLETLKRALEREVARFPMEVVRNSIDEWLTRLRACVRAKGGHFE